MDSVGNQNPWARYKDCSQEICSIYCPQWCSIIFPPPPPFPFEEYDDHDSESKFSPLIIAVIALLVSAFILVSYYTFISKYCRRRRRGNSAIELNENPNQVTNETWRGATSGLDESVIKSITVCKYKKGNGFIEGTDCSVCLAEFQENESLRLLPKCNHAFHLPCIDPWLKSHASCPLCRANIASATSILPTQAPTPLQGTQSSSVTNVSTLEYQHRVNDAVLVVQDLEGNVCNEAAVSLIVGDQDIPKVPIQDPENRQDIEQSGNIIGIVRSI